MAFNLHNQIPSSLVELVQLTETGSQTFTRNPAGFVTEIATALDNGDTRTTTIARNGAGDVVSFTVAFSSSPLTKTYTLVRDPAGTVTGITES